jgi:hypothetical protein
MYVCQPMLRSISIPFTICLCLAVGWCVLVVPAFGTETDVSQPGQRASLLPLGLVDVTAEPYCADPTGHADATVPIRRAMEEARRRKAAVFFPPGVYQVSDTLEYCFHRAAGRKGQDSPCVMIGSREGPNRPKLRLAPNSPGYHDPKRPKMVLHIWARSPENANVAQPNISMNQIVLNLDIEIGAGNPGAVAIHHDAAQGSGIEDVTIQLGDGLAGVVGLQAGGGGTHNVTVIGGSYGIDASDCRATAPTVSGVTLIGQRISALRYNGLETLSLVGARIVVPTGVYGPAIQGVGVGTTKGTMSIVDTQIEFEAASRDNVAIASNRSVYLGNVWVRGAGSIVRTSDGGNLPGNPAEWREIREYAHGVRPPALPPNKQNLQLEHVSYIDGERFTTDVLVSGKDNCEPPADLQSQHVWVPEAGWGTPGAVNVKQAPYNARGDGRTDDTQALQRAIDEHDVVLLPKGTYCVSRTLKLRENTLLVGLRHMSTIAACPTAGGDFTDPRDPRPILQSPDSAEGRTAIAYVGISARDDMPAYMLHWQTGRHSVVRSIFIGSNQGYQQYCSRVSGHGGGRWYSLFKAARMIVEGTSEPLRIYQSNPEWGNRPHMLIRNASDVTIYGLKEEGPRSIAILDCDRISVYGYGGNACPRPGQALLQVERTPNVRLVGLVDRVNIEGSPPTEWYMVTENPPQGPTVNTRPLDRIVLYRRGFETP